MRTLCCLLSWMVLPLGLLAEEGFREFRNAAGQAIQAKLLSHPGDGETVRILMGNGAEADVKVSLFSESDQRFIESWIAINPAKIDYDFDSEMIKQKAGQTMRNRGSYIDYKKEFVKYEITVTNRARQAVPGPTVQYQVFYTDATVGTSSKIPSVTIVFGQKTFDQKIDSRRSVQLFTKTIEIEESIYDGMVRGRDQIDGILVRVLDQQRVLIQEFRQGHAGFQSTSWDAEAEKKQS